SSASRLSSLAYTVGHDIHFAAGQYQPSSDAGQRLIAHELTHTVQQGPVGGVAQSKLEVGSAGSAPEVEADAVADAVVRCAPATISARAGRQTARQTPGNAPTPGTAPAAGTTPAAGAAAPGTAAGTPTPAQQAQHDTAVANHLAQQKRVYALIGAG